MLAVNEINDVYCDALVCDEGYLVFASCWGRDTAIQELLARLTLTANEGGIAQLSFDGHVSSEKVDTPDTKLRFENYPAKIGNPDRLDKMTGRMPKSNLFGDLVHVWLFDKKARQPDFVNREAYLLMQLGQDNQQEGTWDLIKQVCHLPLLEHWQSSIINLMQEQGWLKLISGHGIDVISITLPEEQFDAEISQRVISGLLTLQ